MRSHRHEIGHNFGAIHDCATGCTLTNSNPVCCPLSASTCDSSANFIMCVPLSSIGDTLADAPRRSPVSTRNVSTFSACSIGNVCQVLSGSLNTTCLATPGAATNPTLISCVPLASLSTPTNPLSQPPILRQRHPRRRRGLRPRHEHGRQLLRRHDVQIRSRRRLRPDQLGLLLFDLPDLFGGDGLSRERG